MSDKTYAQRTGWQTFRHMRNANMSTGNAHKPVAWVRFFPNGGPQSVYLDRPPADSEPLYRSPTLTDDEREAIAGAADLMIGSKPGATLRKLLERLK